MQKLKKIHFTDVDTSSAVDLAISLKIAGHSVTFSGSGLNSEAKSKLLINNIIEGNGDVAGDLDALIIGREIHASDPLIKKANDLKIKTYSFSEFVYELAIDKQRIVIAGSTGKTTIILMIIHVLSFHKRKFDYILNSGTGKIASQTKLSDAPLIVIEGQDVMDSSADRVPAFLRYHHHIGLISGIEWQKSDSYPTKEEYTRQFEIFAETTPKGGIMIYFELDPVAAVVSKLKRTDVPKVPYKTHSSDVEGGHEVLVSSEKKKIPLRISGKANLQSVSAAKEVVKKIGITSEMFYEAISTFEGIGH